MNDRKFWWFDVIRVFKDVFPSNISKASELDCDKKAMNISWDIMYSLMWDSLLSLQGCTQPVFSKIHFPPYKRLVLKIFMTKKYPLTPIKSVPAQWLMTGYFVPNGTFSFPLAVSFLIRKAPKSMWFETLVSVWQSLLIIYCWVTNCLNWMV